VHKRDTHCYGIYIVDAMEEIINVFYLITSLVNIILHCAIINNAVVYMGAKKPIYLALIIVLLYFCKKKMLIENRFRTFC